MPTKDTSEEDQVQASAAPASEAAPEPAPSPLTPEPVDKKTAVIVMGGTTVPAADIRIVVESRKYIDATDDAPASVEVKKSHYPTGADIYLRYDPEVQFPKDAKVVTMGVDVQQLNFSGFTRQIGLVNVGPAHPAFAAANLAYQEGATDITIVGLTEAEKERLQPFFDGLATHSVDPAQVTVSLT